MSWTPEHVTLLPRHAHLHDERPQAGSMRAVSLATPWGRGMLWLDCFREGSASGWAVRPGGQSNTTTRIPLVWSQWTPGSVRTTITGTGTCLCFIVSALCSARDTLAIRYHPLIFRTVSASAAQP